MNNPLIYTDPSGEFIWAALGVALKFVGALALKASLILIKGALMSGVMNVISGNPFHYGILKSGVQAVLSAGIHKIDFGTFDMLFRAAAHGFVGGALNSLTGGDFDIGFFASFTASVLGSITEGVTDGLGIKSNAIKTSILYASGIVGGGMGAAIAGGDFWEGAKQGLIVTAFNHGLNSLSGKIFKGRNGQDPKDPYIRNENGGIIADTRKGPNGPINGGLTMEEVALDIKGNGGIDRFKAYLKDSSYGHEFFQNSAMNWQGNSENSFSYNKYYPLLTNRNRQIASWGQHFFAGEKYSNLRHAIGTFVSIKSTNMISAGVHTNANEFIIGNIFDIRNSLNGRRSSAFEWKDIKYNHIGLWIYLKYTAGNL